MSRLNRKLKPIKRRNKKAYDLTIAAGKPGIDNQIAKIQKDMDEFGDDLSKWFLEFGDFAAETAASMIKTNSRAVLRGERSMIGPPKFLHQYREYRGGGSGYLIRDRYTVRHFQTGRLHNEINYAKVADSVYSVGTNTPYAPYVHAADRREVRFGYFDHGAALTKSDIGSELLKALN